jgi:hypothetical protein
VPLWGGTVRLAAHRCEEESEKRQPAKIIAK